MYCNNPILTAANAQLEVTNLTQNSDPATGAAEAISQVPWLPLGTVGDSATGPIGVKMVLLGGSLTPTNPTNPGMPGAANYVAYTYFGSTNNIQTATFKAGGSGGTTVATYTYTYVGSGVANDDKVATLTIT